MAGTSDGQFKEKISRFLADKMQDLARRYGEQDRRYLQIARQYIQDPAEQHVDPALERRRHYEADMPLEFEGQPLKGVERLYRRVMLIEPTTVCAAHCRYCLRANYDMMHLREDDLIRMARYVGSPEHHDDVREVLITGGDPMMIPTRLGILIDALAQHAPQLQRIRIGSRVPSQDPERIDDDLLHAIRPRDQVKIELATQLNVAVELCQPVRDAFARIQEQQVHVYNQSVLMRGVNDDRDELLEVFDALREMGIESHYLFHCVPIKGMSHLRTTVDRGLTLAREITSSGAISGRAKPMFTLMTDLGKVTLYEGTIAGREGRHLLLHTGYRLDDRLKWNPAWQQPDSVIINDDGTMSVWYLDAPEADQQDLSRDVDQLQVEQMARTGSTSCHGDSPATSVRPGPVAITVSGRKWPALARSNAGGSR